MARQRARQEPAARESEVGSSIIFFIVSNIHWRLKPFQTYNGTTTVACEPLISSMLSMSLCFKKETRSAVARQLRVFWLKKEDLLT
jgi:hypothetical protein